MSISRKERDQKNHNLIHNRKMSGLFKYSPENLQIPNLSLNNVKCMFKNNKCKFIEDQLIIIFLLLLLVVLLIVPLPSVVVKEVVHPNAEVLVVLNAVVRILYLKEVVERLLADLVDLHLVEVLLVPVLNLAVRTQIIIKIKALLFQYNIFKNKILN